MGDIEIHIKTGDITYDKTLDAGDRDAARDAQELVAFILGRAAGTASPAPRTASRRARRPAATALAIPEAEET